MKTAMKVLDIVCCVLIGISIIGLIVYLCVYPIIAEQLQEYVTNNVPEEYWKYFEKFMKSSYIVSIVLSLLKNSAALSLAIIGTVQVFKEEKTSNVPHIFLIVAGAITGVPFGIAGGILGLVDNHHNNSNQAVVVEEPKEETIVEVESKDE